MFPLMFGEHLHNNHHYFPSSHTAAFANGEIDLMGGSIKLMEKFGLVTNVKKPTADKYLGDRIDSSELGIIQPSNNLL